VGNALEKEFSVSWRLICKGWMLLNSIALKILLLSSLNWLSTATGPSYWIDCHHKSHWPKLLSRLSQEPLAQATESIVTRATGPSYWIDCHKIGGSFSVWIFVLSLKVAKRSLFIKLYLCMYGIQGSHELDVKQSENPKGIICVHDF